MSARGRGGAAARRPRARAGARPARRAGAASACATPRASARFDRPARVARRAERGFSFVELLVALGIMAFGATIALGLVTMAVRTHARAVERTNAALLADAVAAEVRGSLTATTDLTSLAPASAAGSFYLRKDARAPGYDEYVYDAVITPLDDPDPDQADSFLLEVSIRWRASGKARTAVYPTVVVRQLRHRDLQAP